MFNSGELDRELLCQLSAVWLVSIIDCTNNAQAALEPLQYKSAAC